MNCKDYCNAFRQYCFNLSKLGHRDLTLLLMSNKSLQLFARKAIANGEENKL